MPVTAPLPDGPFAPKTGTPGPDVAALVAYLGEKGRATDAELVAQAATDASRTYATQTALAAKATAPGLRYEFLWNGTAYVSPAGAAVGTRVTGTLRGFIGPADPNALGLMIDGDRWTDTTI